MAPHVKIRKTKNNDFPFIEAIFAEDTMGTPNKAQFLQGLVAVDESDKPVGFIRILKVVDKKKPECNGNYVYPVIVLKSWQGRGVGRRLIEYAHKKHGELRLVACRASRDFYPKCGFEPLAWDKVASRIASDCTYCADLDTCDPKAFILR